MILMVAPIAANINAAVMANKAPCKWFSGYMAVLGYSVRERMLLSGLSSPARQTLETSEKLDQTDDGEAEMGEKAECTRST